MGEAREQQAMTLALRAKRPLPTHPRRSPESRANSKPLHCGKVRSMTGTEHSLSWKVSMKRASLRASRYSAVHAARAVFMPNPLPQAPKGTRQQPWGAGGGCQIRI